MKTSEKGIKLIQEFESCKLKAYLDSVKIPTIGYGNTFYEDGSKVKLGDVITKERANSLFHMILSRFERGVETLLTSKVNQNQFDALVSIAYNIGLGNLKKSTLLKLVNSNPNDTKISSAFMLWNKAKGEILNGLTKRRSAEAQLYFSKL
jgi:lysozyme